MTVNKVAPEAMIFDLDGTLFQTETLLVPAYHATFEKLREERLHTGETPDVSIMLGCLGMLLEQIWKQVIPDASPEAHRRADELLEYFEDQGLRLGQGLLYPEVKETLDQLHRKGIRLFVASNGLESYVKGVIHSKGLAHLFDGLYSAGEYKTKTKVDLVRILLEKHGVKTAWMVGDRSSDVEAGKGNGLEVVGCRYAGFGKEDELAGADRIIQQFSELAVLV